MMLESTAAEAPMPASMDEAPRETAAIEERETELPRELRPDRDADRPERSERRDFKPAPPAAVAEAIEEVNLIIASLKRVLDEMEEILETLELAEVQKTADEREIQSLRSALRQLDRRGPIARQEQPRSLEREGGEQRGSEPRRRDDRRPSRG